MTTEEHLHAQLRGNVPCPACGSSVSEVTNSRWSKTANGRSRRRKCSACNFAFTTMEMLYEGGTNPELPLTKLPDFVSRIRGVRCKKCNGEGVIRRGMRIARVMKEFRQESGKTAKEVAAAIGMAYPNYINLENGKQQERYQWNSERIQKVLLACSK